MKLKFDGFILALFCFIVLAYYFPQLYLWQGGQIIGWTTSIGVSLIFFFYGLKLSFQQLKVGLRNWKLHLLVQGATFVLFPLLLLPFYPFVQNELQYDFWLSFFFLAALPSTVSSSVVMVSIARGNISAAIFNASISGLIGVIITPLWMQFFLDFGEIDVFGDVYWGLIKEIIIPVIAGLLLQPYLGKWALRYNRQLTLFDKSVILLIVYCSFAESFVSGVFESMGKLYLLWTFVGVVLLFILVYGLIYVFAKFVLNFNREDCITALFCGSKKSLTHGSVFGKFLFAHSISAGLYFLPLMIFHAFQILVVTVIAQRYHREDTI
ncbi:bile acid:sodium symporter [Sphingobacterium sp. DN00404]|uniref:Bile acid:sodium symporter n=1 Tax=Sphingobacterium micropteri TaxID=2763501 RepID=A0ABR7YM90_9SPHI|nr:bile acid:sodium symporter family protein [Sphingobacterium micropteri]MBD1432438.1 bile acid:sodium symporter [Sphingobacterium micropteri]